MSVFEAAWAIFYNFFIWYYIAKNLEEFTLSAEHIRRLLLIPILIVGYVSIAAYAYIIVAAVVVGVGGHCTGYWSKDGRKVDKERRNGGLDSSVREKLMEIHN